MRETLGKDKGSSMHRPLAVGLLLDVVKNARNIDLTCAINTDLIALKKASISTTMAPLYAGIYEV